MTTYVVDATAVIELVANGFADPGAHQLMAPTLLRSQTLSLLHEAVTTGGLTEQAARDHLERISSLPIRLLGDARLRRAAWRVASELAWAETYDAEYVALIQLHGDALITADPKLASALNGVVEVEPVRVLL